NTPVSTAARTAARTACRTPMPEPWLSLPRLTSTCPGTSVTLPSMIRTEIVSSGRCWLASGTQPTINGAELTAGPGPAGPTTVPAHPPSDNTGVSTTTADHAKSAHPDTPPNDHLSRNRLD